MSNSNTVFADSFLNHVREVLDESCPEGTGQCVTRSALVKKLDLDPKLRLDSTLGAVVSLGYIEGYEVRSGSRGGIGRVGEKPEKKTPKPSAPQLSEEFKGKLMATLQTLCDSSGTPVPRKVVAQKMDMDNVLPLISAALQLDEFSEFATKIGKGGGVYRVSATEETVGEDFTSSMADTVTETEDEDTTVEAV